MSPLRVGRRSAAVIRGGVLLGLAAVLAIRHLDGSLGYYINLRYGWLTVVAIACLAVLGVVVLAAGLRPGHVVRQTPACRCPGWGLRSWRCRWRWP